MKEFAERPACLDVICSPEYFHNKARPSLYELGVQGGVERMPPPRHSRRTRAPAPRWQRRTRPRPSDRDAMNGLASRWCGPDALMSADRPRRATAPLLRAPFCLSLVKHPPGFVVCLVWCRVAARLSRRGLRLRKGVSPMTGPPM